MAVHVPAAAPAASSSPDGGLASSSQNAATDAPSSAAVDTVTAKPVGSGGTAQQIIKLLADDAAAKDLPAGTQGKSSTDARAADAVAQSTASDAAPGDNRNSVSALAQSLTQVGAPSHFAREMRAGALQTPVGSRAWTEELGGHLTWMTQKGIESGSLRVSPEHLGPVEVQISIHNGSASVWFGASHPDTRAALEQTLPRLREMFASQGMTLSDSGVSRESPRNRPQPSAPHGIAAISGIGGSEAGATIAARVSLGLVDTYA